MNWWHAPAGTNRLIAFERQCRSFDLEHTDALEDDVDVVDRVMLLPVQLGATNA